MVLEVTNPLQALGFSLAGQKPWPVVDRFDLISLRSYSLTDPDEVGGCRRSLVFRELIPVRRQAHTLDFQFIHEIRLHLRSE